MIPIDLVTGFLGAGKTTFIKKYVEYLNGCGYKVGIIENDFGAVNVDMLMLQDVLGEKCDVEQIVGGHVVTDWKRRFRTKLISMAMRGFQRIIVEPSGIYDVDAFFDVLYDEPIDSWYEVGNVYTIVDGGLESKISRQEEYLMVSQVANCGKVILSKVKELSPERAMKTVDMLNIMLESFKCNRKLGTEDVLTKDWDRFTDEDFEQLMKCGYRKADHEKLWFDQKQAFSSLFFMEYSVDENSLKNVLQEVFEDEEVGMLFRIKGYLPLKDGQWLQINATKYDCETEKVAMGQKILIAIGQGLNEEVLRQHLNY